MSSHTNPDVDPRGAYRRSIALLKANSAEHGFLASSLDRGNYRSVWARDGCICAVAAYVSGDEELIDTARRTLRTLPNHQADNGQAPSYLAVDSEGRIGQVNYGGLGEVTSIDANSCGLLEMPIAGDWSDILNRSYHVLYDEVLWFRALFSAAELSRDASHDEEARYYARAAERVWCRLNVDFWWDSTDTMKRVAEKHKIHNELPLDRELPYYQSHLTPFLNTWSGRFDAFAEHGQRPVEEAREIFGGDRGERRQLQSEGKKRK